MFKEGDKVKAEAIMPIGAKNKFKRGDKVIHDGTNEIMTFIRYVEKMNNKNEYGLVECLDSKGENRFFAAEAIMPIVEFKLMSSHIISPDSTYTEACDQLREYILTAFGIPKEAVESTPKDLSECSAHWINPITGICPDCKRS